MRWAAAGEAPASVRKANANNVSPQNELERRTTFQRLIDGGGGGEGLVAITLRWVKSR